MGRYSEAAIARRIKKLRRLRDFDRDLDWFLKDKERDLKIALYLLKPYSQRKKDFTKWAKKQTGRYWKGPLVWGWSDWYERGTVHQFSLGIRPGEDVFFESDEVHPVLMPGSREGMLFKLKPRDLAFRCVERWIRMSKITCIKPGEWERFTNWGRLSEVITHFKERFGVDVSSEISGYVIDGQYRKRVVVNGEVSEVSEDKYEMLKKINSVRESLAA